MEEIIRKILLIICAEINIFIFVKQSLKLYQEIQNQKMKIKKQAVDASIKKLKLSRNLQDIKNADLKAPLYAKLNQKDKEILLKTTEQLKDNKPEIYIFATKLLENIKVDSIRNLLINAPDITINYHKPKKKSNIAGTYSSYSKTIDIYDSKNDITLHHELLHAASTSHIFKNIGFKVNLKQIGTFGEGLNEGYTELLNNRFFKTKSKSYIYLQKLAQLIENFYENKEEMVEDYFNADPFKLIGELLKSMSLEEAIDIIVDMDQLLDQSDLNYFKYLKIKQKILNIYNRKNDKQPNAKNFVKTILPKNKANWQNLTKKTKKDIIKHVWLKEVITCKN